MEYGGNIMKSKLEINGKKVYKNGKEVKGSKKILYMIFGYLLAAIVLVSVIAILLLVGGVLTIGIPVIIGIVILCIFLSLIIGIIKIIFR